MALFKLRLEKTYWEQGFFNIIKEYDRFVRSSEGKVTLRLGKAGPEVEGRIDRRANQNGTARIMGGTVLRDWFQANFKPMDVVPVDPSSPEVIVLEGLDQRQ